jgi:hypothetical protein
MTFARMIEQMEDLVLSGIDVPLTPWTLVNADKLVPLLDSMRDNLPEEIRKSRMVLERREELLSDAQNKAAQIVEEARARADMMLSESELLRAVQIEVEKVRDELVTEMEALRKKTFEETESMKARAIEESRAVREGADQYAEMVLNGLERNLSDIQAVVQNGQRQLKRSKAETAGAPYKGHASQPNRSMPPSMQPQSRSRVNTAQSRPAPRHPGVPV